MVSYDVDEGSKVRIDEIIFEGNEAFSDKKLLKQLETNKHGWLSWLTGSGNSTKRNLKKISPFCVNFIVTLVISIVRSTKRRYPLICRVNEIVITIPIVEGQLYYLGDFLPKMPPLTTDELLTSCA